MTAAGWVPPGGAGGGGGGGGGGTAATRLVLVRHGATAHSADRRFSGRNELPLEPEGTAQAAALAARLRDLTGVAALLSSPLRRARQTADWIAAGLGLDVEVDDDLAELDFGEWEGLSFAEARARDPRALAAWLAAPGSAPPGGEALEDLAARVARARERVAARHAGRTVVLVSHVTPIKQLLREALGAPAGLLSRLHLDTASVSLLDLRGDGGASVRLVNDTSHLGRPAGLP